MRALWRLAYSSIVIPFLWTALHVLALFNAKVRRGIAGRRGLFEDLARRASALPAGKRVWFHASSMGEFEQAKPIIAALKRSAPDIRVIASFFSPSGYEHSRKYPHADVICYLPLDTRRNARRFLDIIRPDVAVFIRYDVWPNHVWELHRRGIPSFIASATMRRQTRRRMPFIRYFHHHVYDPLDEILAVSRADVEAFSFFRLRHPRVEAIGDTRFDQVTIRSAEARKHTTLPAGVTAGRSVLVVGSSWPEDEAVLLPAIVRLQKEFPHLLTILVPHEPTVIHLEELERELNGSLTHLRFSELNDYAGEQVVVVDSIGILLRLYAHAHVAYIGGSFRQGVHNVLEAAVYGIPVIFGPRHRNSQEPLQLVERGGAFVVNDEIELERTLRGLLANPAGRERTGASAAAFVAAHTGATDRFLARLAPRLGMQKL